jgi:hypothetical protein
MRMAGDERVRPQRDRSCEAIEGGYTIVLDEGRVTSFFEAGDFSSGSELDHFKEIGANIEKRIKEGGGYSLLALSVGDKTISRDFAVLQIAHTLAKHGRSVLVVDCDFRHPGLSGLVENVEAHGFLDLLLYGSSLKTVAQPIGIDGVSVTGPGSFPVSRTVPFALKEFDKLRDFLRTKHDVVVYCSTLYAEDGSINPLGKLVDGIALCCRIEHMAEGELQKNLKDLAAARVPPVEVVCFCGQKEGPVAAAAKKAAPSAPREMPTVEFVAGAEEPLEMATTGKADELAPPAPRKKPRVSVARILAVSAAALIVVFIVWWVAINRTVRQPGPSGKPAGVAVQSQDTTSREQPQAAESISAAAAGTPGGGIDTTGAKAVAARSERPSAVPQRAPGGEGRPAARDTGRAQISPIAATPKYTIHVASFTQMFRAEAEKKYLADNGFDARIVEVDIRGEKWLRVFAGSYATMEEADAARIRLLSLKRIGDYARIVKLSDMGR